MPFYFLDLIYCLKQALLICDIKHINDHTCTINGQRNSCSIELQPPNIPKFELLISMGSLYVEKFGIISSRLRYFFIELFFLKLLKDRGFSYPCGAIHYNFQVPVNHIFRQCLNLFSLHQTFSLEWLFSFDTTVSHT